MFLDTVICEGLDYAMMSALASCQLYTTTSTTTDPSQVNIIGCVGVLKILHKVLQSIEQLDLMLGLLQYSQVICS